jgi:MFS family permease
LIWFIYDFSSYSFSIYSSEYLAIIIGDSAPLWKTFGWTTLTYCFYLPGSALGAYASDWIGPRNTLALGVALQGIVGFIMTGCYPYLATPQNVAAFVVVYG